MLHFLFFSFIFAYVNPIEIWALIICMPFTFKAEFYILYLF